jgi:uncharacterized protein YyaL (SSP411 family)
MMEFINKQSGRGGWPLNVFLTPLLHPVYALTYAPAVSRDSMNSLLSVSAKVFEYLGKNAGAIPLFISHGEQTSVSEESALMKTLSSYYDAKNGGFGHGQKFPSHSTLLYLLYQLAIDDSPSIKTIVTKTLGAMCRRGLNDHLQGGIFRYCVDAEWTIPHFEKMLYDQALALWTYSLAFRVTATVEYKTMADSILRCLEESFRDDGLYISAHDADTGHKEGATYLWSWDQLKSELLPDEFEKLAASYHLSGSGNFDGLNHLIRKNDIPLKEIEDKLLSIRRKRKQPSRDEKILSGVNTLVAIAMIQAGRFLDRPDLEKKASDIIKKIIGRFWNGERLGHSYFKGVLQQQSFLSDAAAMLTAVTMLCESDASWRIQMNNFAHYVESFREGENWIESDADDFQKVYASRFDHPVPAGVSVAEMGLARFAVLGGKENPVIEYRQPFQSDFHNLGAMINNGLFHIFTTREFVPWNSLPVNSIQVRGEPETDCYMGTCSRLESM